MSDLFSYATPEDLATYENIQVEDSNDASRLLHKASIRVSGMLKTARYQVNADGTPTDPAVAALFAEATCAQAAYMQALDDMTGAKALKSGGSIGRVTKPSLKGDGSIQDRIDQRFSPAAYEVLHRPVKGLRWGVQYG